MSQSGLLLSQIRRLKRNVFVQETQEFQYEHIKKLMTNILKLRLCSLFSVHACIQNWISTLNIYCFYPTHTTFFEVHKAEDVSVWFSFIFFCKLGEYIELPTESIKWQTSPVTRFCAPTDLQLFTFCRSFRRLFAFEYYLDFFLVWSAETNWSRSTKNVAQAEKKDSFSHAKYQKVPRL